MNSIQPISSSASGAGQPLRTPAQSEAGGASPAQASTASTAATSITATSSTTMISMAHSRVDSMLSSLGIDPQNNQVLRMIIALLILEALLAQDGGSQQAGGVGLMGGDLLARFGANAQQLSIRSETNMIQVQQQSTSVSTPQAVQTIAQSGGQPGSEGGELDVHA